MFNMKYKNILKIYVFVLWKFSYGWPSDRDNILWCSKEISGYRELIFFTGEHPAVLGTDLEME